MTGPRVRSYHVELEQEDNGRWIAEVVELPGVIVYGDTPSSATARVKALAFRVLADQVERDESPLFDLQFA